jgi:hypothetical protein
MMDKILRDKILRENETPEEAWIKVKDTVFKGQVPKSLDVLMNDAFKDSEDESEKWLKLGILLKELQDKINT